MTKIKFNEFIRAYVDFYTLYDKEMLDSVLQWDEDSLDFKIGGNSTIKHQSIRQILNQK